MSPSSKRRRDASSHRPRPEPAPPPEREVPEVEDEDEAEEATPELRRAGRLAPAAGIAYVMLALLGSSLVPMGEAEPEQDAAAIAREFTENRGQVSAGVLLLVLAIFFLMVFVAWLHRWLRSVEGPDGWLSSLALIGGVTMVVALSVIVLLTIAGTVLEDYGPDPVVARTLLVLQWQSVVMSFIPTAAFIGATSLVTFGAEVMPRWLTYSGLAIALGLLLPPVWFFAFFASSLWIGMLAVLLLQRSRLGWA